MTVDLAKTRDIQVRPRGWLVPLTKAVEARDMVVRARQATARAAIVVVDQPLMSRTVDVGRQLPKAGVKVVARAPHGLVRAVCGYVDWLRDADTLTLQAHAAETKDFEAHHKATKDRNDKDLPRRRAINAIVLALLAVLGMAWWLPKAFAGVLAVLVFVGLVALAPRKHVGEMVDGLVIAAIGGVLTWLAGTWLASRIPYPAPWMWLVLLAVAVPVLGWFGRHQDQPLVKKTATMEYKPPPITAPMIVEALFRIGVPTMTPMAAERGMRDEVRVRAPGVGRSKHGWEIELELPPGVTAGDIARQREELAGALRRPLGCVWPSGGGDHPGHWRLYIGEKPMATAPQTEWPLAAGQPIDIFDPFPLFTDKEGRWVDVTLLGTHAVVAGASGFGKSVTLRQLAVACGLDLRARLYVFDGKISGDLAPVQKIAHAYYEGAEPDDIAEQLAAMQDIEHEMRRRAKFLRNLPPEERSPKVTTVLASKYSHLSPIVLLIDECQEYTEYGVKGIKEDKQIREAFVATLTRISRLGRSAGIAMVLVSQKPEAAVIPTAIMGNCSIRVCHKVTEQNHNDQVMGTSAYKNGYNAALFSQEDRGLAWLRAEGDPQVVRSWSQMVDLEAAVELVDKAHALRRARGLLTGQAADEAQDLDEIVYDIVQDAELVMRQHQRGRAQWAELVPWLQEFRPTQYADLNVDGLSTRLRDEGVKVSQIRIEGVNRQGVRLSDLQKRGDNSGEED